MRKNKQRKRLLSLALASILAVSALPAAAFAQDEPANVPDNNGKSEGDPASTGEASGSYEPWIHGYRFVDLLNFDPKTDPYAEEMRATIPLQQRNETFAATQANPWLEDKAWLYTMSSGSYRSTDVVEAPWNGNTSYDEFSYNPFKFWQYSNISGTGGRPTAGIEINADAKEYGTVAIPSAAGTNVAHKNGVLSMGEFFIPRNPQFSEEWIYKDEDGNFPYAQKLLDIMEYYGFDGYFINQEESINSGYVQTYREMLQWMREHGAYVQWYDSITNNGNVQYQNAFNENNRRWVYDDDLGRVAHSIFMNYSFPENGIKDANALATALGLDPYEAVFMGVEGGLWKFMGDFDYDGRTMWDGSWGSGYLKAIDENEQPYTSFAIWGSDFYHEQYNKPSARYEIGYQWEAEERERMYYNSRTENAGDYSEVARPDVGVTELTDSGRSFKGFSKYVVEKSVINGNVFATDFNVGRGLSYWIDGRISRDMEWTNYELQDILPTWQWWVEGADIPAEAKAITSANDEENISDEDAAPVKEETSDEDETPAKEEAPDEDGTPAKEEAPDEDGTPAKEEAPDEDGTPAKEETPDEDGTPAKEETPDEDESSDKKDTRAAETLLNLDWDYGPDFYRLDSDGNEYAFEYTQIGAYNGGSSLAVYGELTGSQIVHLYKTDLDVETSSALNLTYYKPSATDSSTMYAVLSLKDGDSVEKVWLPIENSGARTDGWTTATVDLSDLAGRTIAAIGLGISAEEEIPDYQVNLGRLEVTDGEDYTPSAPTGLQLVDRFDGTGEIRIAWDMEEYDTVRNYHIYAVYSDGSERFVGGAFAGNYFIRTLEDEQNVTGLRLYAVGRDGSLSRPAELSLATGSRISDVRVTSENKKLNVTWDEPAGVSSVEVALEYWYSDKENPAPVTVSGGVCSAELDVPAEDGTKYIITVTANNGEPVSFFGQLNDTYCAPYDGEARVMPNGKIYLTTPAISDYSAMYVEIDGTTTTYTRFGANVAKNISIPSSGSVTATITLEDMSGNQSKPVTLLFIDGVPASDSNEFEDELFPDPVLRQLISEKVGTTYADLIAYTGTLDLSNTNVSDLTGMQVLACLEELDLSNTKIATVTGDMLPGSVLTKLKLDNCAQLETVDLSSRPKAEVSVSGCANLVSLLLPGTKQTALDIRGANKLHYFNISNSQIETLTADDASAYANAFLWQWENAKMELASTTAEGELKDGVVNYFNSVNLSPEISEKESELYYAGNWNTYTDGASHVFDLGSEQKVSRITFQNYYQPSYGDNYCLVSADVSVSSDGENYTKVYSLTGGGYNIEMKLPEDTFARYIKVDNCYSPNGTMYTYYWTFHGYEVRSAAFTYDNQQPTIHVDEIANLTVKDNGNVYQALDLLDDKYNSAVTAKYGTPARDLVDEPWIDSEYVTALAIKPSSIRVAITGPDGDYIIPTEGPVLGTIDTEKALEVQNVYEGACTGADATGWMLFDNDAQTKWCAEVANSWVGFELTDGPKVLGQWDTLHAGSESPNFIASAFRLQVLDTDKVTEKAYLEMDEAGKKAILDDSGNWKDLITVTGNTTNELTREPNLDDLTSAQVYRFYIDVYNQPGTQWGAIRVYGMDLYAYTGELGGEDTNGLIRATPEAVGTYQVRYIASGSEIESTVIAVEHDLVNEEIIKQPTCTEPGQSIGACKNCSYTDEKITQVIQPTGHTMVHHDAVEATYSAPGNVEYWQCTVCGKYYLDAKGNTETTLEQITIPKLVLHSHTMVHHDAVEATYSAPGNIEYWQCTACGKYYLDAKGSIEATLEQITIPKLVLHSHTMVHHDTINATYSAPGNIEYWQCTACGKYYLDAEGNTETTLERITIPKLIPPDPSDDPVPSNPSTDPSTDPSKPDDTSTPNHFTGDTYSTVNTEVTGTKASVKLDSKAADAIIAEAVERESANIILTVDAPTNSTEAVVTIPASTMTSLTGKTQANLTVKTQAANVTIPQAGLASMNTSEVEVSTQTSGNTVQITVAKDGQAVANVPGGIQAEIAVTNATPGTVAVLVDENGKETILKKAVVLDGSLNLALNGSATIKSVDNSKDFADTQNHWAADSIDFVTSRELFQGTGPNTFEADISMSRAMLVTVLHRLEDLPAGTGNGFVDVPSNAYYADAVTWASGLGIVTGDGTGFNPDGEITREQMVAILFRYSKAIGTDVSASGSLSSFSDTAEVSGWATEAMQWSVGAGIIGGSDGKLNPRVSATRAEVSTVLMRFCQYIAK